MSLKAPNSLRSPYNDYAILNFSVAGVHVSGTGIVIVEDGCLGAVKIENECNIIGIDVGKHFSTMSLFEATDLRVTKLSKARVEWEHAFVVCVLNAKDESLEYMMELAVLTCKFLDRLQKETRTDSGINEMLVSQRHPKMCAGEGNQGGSRVVRCTSPATGKVYQLV